MVQCGYKDENHKYMCLKEIGVHAHNILTILGSMFNMFEGGGGGLYDHAMTSRILKLIINNFIQAPQVKTRFGSDEENDDNPRFEFVNHLALNCVFHILQEVGCIAKVVHSRHAYLSNCKVGHRSR